MEREDGFYWVKYIGPWKTEKDGNWNVMEYYKNCWYLTGHAGIIEEKNIAINETRLLPPK